MAAEPTLPAVRPVDGHHAVWIGDQLVNPNDVHVIRPGWREVDTVSDLYGLYVRQLELRNGTGVVATIDLDREPRAQLDLTGVGDLAEQLARLLWPNVTWADVVEPPR